MTLLGLFAALALLLALAGLYGVISQSVGQRAKKLGVRIALGASGREVMALVMRQGMVPALMGIGFGLVVTMGMSRAIGALLYGVSATDPLTYAGVALLLAAAAGVACWVPARATLRMEASSVLRE
jgi:ABC-type antimicrobial peptide transport system permease subunit